MLKRAFLLWLLASPAFAQQSPPSASPDPADIIATYRQLLSEANDRIAALSAQVQANARAAAAKGEQKPEAKK